MSTASLLICTVTATRTDEVVMRLFDAGATAVAESPMGDSTELQAGFATADDADRARRELPLGVPSRVTLVRSDTWIQSQRAGLHPVIVGPFEVRAPWHPRVRATSAIPLIVDPGGAFGHGGHPSTRLLLGMLADEIQPGMSVVDVGTGTGVLAIAAATLGASVLAVDIDPGAVEVARANVERNHVADCVEVSRVDESDITLVTADLALVNVTIGGHRAVAPRLATVASVAISGITDGQSAEAFALYRPRTVSRLERFDDWIAALLT